MTASSTRILQELFATNARKALLLITKLENVNYQLVKSVNTGINNLLQIKSSQSMIKLMAIFAEVCQFLNKYLTLSLNIDCINGC